MTKFLSFKRTDPAASGFQRSEHLVKISSIVDVNQTANNQVVINLDNALAGFDVLTIEASGFLNGFPVLPTWNPNTAPLADMINNAITANPGGVKVKVIPPSDSQGEVVRIYSIVYS